MAACSTFRNSGSSVMRCFSNALSSVLGRQQWISGSRICSSILPVNSRSCSRSSSTSSQPIHSSRALLSPPCTLPTMPHQRASGFHTSIAARGLEEFFDDPKNFGQPTVKAGRGWSKDELRLKDFVTLHKLWYVLLKERNMLNTMLAEADRQKKFLPSAERINKVQVSMDNLQAVLKERQEALTELKTGHTEEHPGEWQNTAFGFKRFVKPKEHKIPKYMNRFWSSKRKWYDPFFGRYLTQYYEQQIRRGAKTKRRERNQLNKLKKRFPDSDAWKQ